MMAIAQERQSAGSFRSAVREICVFWDRLAADFYILAGWDSTSKRLEDKLLAIATDSLERHTETACRNLSHMNEEGCLVWEFPGGGHVSLVSYEDFEIGLEPVIARLQKTCAEHGIIMRVVPKSFQMDEDESANYIRLEYRKEMRGEKAVRPRLVTPDQPPREALP